jgi:predicted TIM-barrel fold metal-dependent hydrolase
LCAAHNDWIAAEWLDKEPRLRASIVINPGRPQEAAAEIERIAARDKRFVQVILPVQSEVPLGRPIFKPIFEACVRHDLTIGLHAGSMFRNAPSQSGYYSTFSEDYAAHISAFTAQVANFLSEAVFVDFPTLKLVLIESGVSWMPPFMWRFSKDWRGVRNEVPWIDRHPADIMREHVFLTTQPFDAPETAVAKVIEQLGSADMLLFASDHPHWHYDGDQAVPPGMPDEHLDRLFVKNALRAYPRLGDLQ